MKFLLLCIVFCVGMLQPVQAGMNAEFRRHSAHPLQAGALNMIVGAAVVVLVLLLVLRLPLPTRASLAAAPWWSLLGGCVGATIVFVMLVAAPKLGAALLIAAFVAGQLTSSAVIDHHGLVGYPVRQIGLGRIVGFVLLGAGVLLIERTAHHPTP